MYDDVMAALPKLTTKQLRDIRKICDDRIRNDRDPSGSFELIVLDALVETLRVHGLPSSYVILRNSSAYPSFRDKIDDLEKFFIKSHCQRTTLHFILILALRSMIYRFRKFGMLVDNNVLMANIHKLPAYLEQDFPGYAKAGYLSKIHKHGRGREK